jgi:hypothetical protein
LGYVVSRAGNILMSDFVLAGTGHRPPRLGLGYDPESNRLLTEFAESQLRGDPPARLLSGMAQGWDSAIAHAAVRLGIPLVCAVPFEGQESRWPPDAQARFRALLAKAKEVVVVCDGGYANWKFVKRDEWLVDHADCVLSLLDNRPERSGTRTTVEYALGKGVRVVNCWPWWESFRRRAGVSANSTPRQEPAGEREGTRTRGLVDSPRPS